MGEKRERRGGFSAAGAAAATAATAAAAAAADAAVSGRVPVRIPLTVGRQARSAARTGSAGARVLFPAFFVLLLEVLAALAALLFFLPMFAGCAQTPSQTPEEETKKYEYDREAYREAYRERADQEGFVSGDSKYGFAFPEITEYAEGFVDFRPGTTVSFSAPLEGLEPDFIEGEGGDVFSLSWRRAVFIEKELDLSLVDDPASADLSDPAYWVETEVERVVRDGILLYHPDGSYERICEDPDCSPDEYCPHNMNMQADTYLRYYGGNLFFVGARLDPILDENGRPTYDALGLPVKSRKNYVMRYDIEAHEFHKLIEFLDQQCFLFEIHDGVLYMVSGSNKEHAFTAIDLENGAVCRMSVGQSFVYGVIGGKLLLQSPSYVKGTTGAAEYGVILKDGTGSVKRVASYTHSFCGAAGEYIVYLQRWENGKSYDLCRRLYYADKPEVMGRDAVKFRVQGDICVWLAADGTLWRSDVIAFSPRKIATKVVDFSLHGSKIVFLRQNSGLFRGTSETYFENRSDLSLWVSTGFGREKVWDSTSSTRYFARCGLGDGFLLVTALSGDEVVTLYVDFDEEDRRVVSRRPFDRTAEIWSAYHIVEKTEE